MRRMLVVSFFALAALVALPALAAEPVSEPLVTPAEPLPIEPLQWFETTGLSSCTGACDGFPFYWKCENLNPNKCCQLLKELHLCSNFVGTCSGAWDAFCQF